MEATNPPGTRLESDEEIRQTQQLLRNARTDGKAIAKEKLFQPVVRPPVAILTVYDDGAMRGENIRIRTDQFIIGRTEGDFQLRHGELLLSRHVNVTRQLFAGSPGAGSYQGVGLWLGFLEHLADLDRRRFLRFHECSSRRDEPNECERNRPRPSTSGKRPAENPRNHQLPK